MQTRDVTGEDSRSELFRPSLFFADLTIKEKQIKKGVDVKIKGKTFSLVKMNGKTENNFILCFAGRAKSRHRRRAP